MPLGVDGVRTGTIVTTRKTRAPRSGASSIAADRRRWRREELVRETGEDLDGRLAGNPSELAFFVRAHHQEVDHRRQVAVVQQPASRLPDFRMCGQDEHVNVLRQVRGRGHGSEQVPDGLRERCGDGGSNMAKLCRDAGYVHGLCRAARRPFQSTSAFPAFAATAAA